jgi:hypothetical protein
MVKQSIVCPATFSKYARASSDAVNVESDELRAEPGTLVRPVERRKQRGRRRRSAASLMRRRMRRRPTNGDKRAPGPAHGLLPLEHAPSMVEFCVRIMVLVRTPIAFARGQATAPAPVPNRLGANVRRSSRNAIPQKQYPYSSARVTPTCGMPRIAGRLSLASRNIRSAPDDAHFELPCTASFLVPLDSRNHHAHIEIPLVAT